MHDCDTATVVALLVALTALPVLSAAGAVPASARAASRADVTIEPTEREQASDDLVDDCAAAPPSDFADPETDALGWVDGVWYNESIAADESDRVSEDQLANFTARTAARVEALRCLSMESLPNVTVVSYEEYQSQRPDSLYSPPQRQFMTGKHATMLTVGHDQDPVRERHVFDGSSGFYRSDNTIRLVVNESGPVAVPEATLAHELTHALQAEHFSFTRGGSTDRRRALNSLPEGDGRYVELRYLQRCEADRWNAPCRTAPQSTGPETVDGALRPAFEFSYSEGAAYVHRLREAGGWDAVDARYEDPPVTTAEIIDSDSDADYDSASVSPPYASDDRWTFPSITADPVREVIGRAGLSSMFIGPALESDDERLPSAAQVRAPEDPYRTWNYDLPQTDGWRGDKMRVYTNDAGETAVIWRIAWNNDTDAREFADAYRSLVECRGGGEVDGASDVYAFPDDSAFEMAVALRTQGENVTVVTAPNVSLLTTVHDGLELDGSSSAGNRTGTAGSATTTTSTGDVDEAGSGGDADGSESVSTTTTSDSGPGFTPAVALVALAIAAALAVRRR